MNLVWADSGNDNATQGWWWAICSPTFGTMYVAGPFDTDEEAREWRFFLADWAEDTIIAC